MKDVAPSQCVVAGFLHVGAAQDAFRALDRIQQRISKRIVFDEPQVRVVLNRLLPKTDRSLPTAVVGAIVGAAMGLIAGLLVAIMLPAEREFVSRVLVALGIAVVGGVCGGLIGAMSGWERADDKISRYEEAVAQGYVLIVANAAPRELAEAIEVLEALRPDLLDTHATTADDHAGETRVAPDDYVG